MRKRKGISTVLISVFGVFGSLVALVILGFQAGSIFTSFESFLSFLWGNVWNIVIFGTLIAGTWIVVRNAGQNNPKWGEDLQGFGIVIGIFIVVVIIVPLASGAISGFEADVTVTFVNPIGDVQVTEVEVTNFRQVGPASIFSQFPSATFGLFGDQINGNLVAECDGEIVDTSSYEVWVIESPEQVFDAEIDKTVTNLPSGASCTLVVEQTNTADGETKVLAEESFTVPNA